MSGLSLNNNIIRVKVDDQTINFDNAGNLAVKTIDTNQIADNAVGTSQVADSSITKAKIEDVTNMRVLGNTSGSDAAPQEVSVLDEDDMTSDSPTALATQQSIKAYVDSFSSTDGFSPTSYTGGESVTFPNGLIMKWGLKNVGNGTTTVTFDTPFPNAIVNVQYSRQKDNWTTYNDNGAIGLVSGTSSFSIYIENGSTWGSIYWQAIGY